MRLVRLLLTGFVAAVAITLSGCAGMESFIDSEGAHPVSSLFQQSAPPAHRFASGALQPSQYAEDGGSAAVVEPGDGSQASFDQAATDPDLAKLSVNLSFVDTDVRQFAKVLFSQLLKKPYVIDPNISGNVTLRSGGNVDGNAALVLARQALESVGDTISLADGVYRVGALSSQGANANGDLQTYALQYIDSDSAKRALQPLIDGHAEIVSSTDTSLSLRGDRETLTLVGSMLKTIDIDRFKRASFGLFPLKNAVAKDVVEELRSLYSGVGVTGETLLPIDRMDAVLIITEKPDQLAFAQKWVARLDQGQQNERQLFTYQVQHRKADDLAALLSQIFSSAHVGVAVTADASVVPASNAGVAQAPTSGAFTQTPMQAAAVTAEPSSPTDDGIKITADAGSNTLVVWAKQSEFDLISRALQRLDTPLKQVYVEATIAEVKLSNEVSNGVRAFLQSGAFGVSATDNSSGAFGASFPGFNFSLSVPEAQVVISALQSHTDVKIVSSPNLTVIDQQTATIQVGDQVPIVTKSVQDTTSGANIVANDVEFRDTGVILKVTPQIRSANEVLLAINQEVSSVVPTTSSAIDSPTISQRKIESTVLVPNGNAIVLGGLISTDNEASGDGLPGTQKTILETLFGSHKATNSRSELIVIIRPVIIQDQSDMKDVIAEIASKMSNVMNAPVQ